MDAQVAQHLLDLNHQFYQTFASQFSATRGRLQPGVRRVLGSIPVRASVLDLGCGNGELYRALVRGGFRGLYIGIDASAGLLEIARSTPPEIQAMNLPVPPEFLQADLSAPNWDGALASWMPSSGILKFDFILAFAVLHHLPGWELRRQTLAIIRRWLTSGGLFIHSEWQFLNSPRLLARILPWQAAGLREDQVDPGDYLLDWRQGGYGLRYVHHFTPEELAQLGLETGFQILNTFYSDGQEGNLAIYQTWQ
jgi:SAM-dependent methyltransferase